MLPLKVFIPSQTNYLMAMRYLKTAEKDFLLIKQGKSPSFYNQGETRYVAETAKDAAKIEPMSDKELDAFRMGMHLSAAAITSQLLKDIAENKLFFQSIGKLDEIENTVSKFTKDNDEPASYNDLKELEELLHDRLRNVQNQIQLIKKNLVKSYPYQLLLDLAADETT